MRATNTISSSPPRESTLPLAKNLFRFRAGEIAYASNKVANSTRRSRTPERVIASHASCSLPNTTYSNVDRRIQSHEKSTEHFKNMNWNQIDNHSPNQVYQAACYKVNPRPIGDNNNCFSEVKMPETYTHESNMSPEINYSANNEISTDLLDQTLNMLLSSEIEFNGGNDTSFGAEGFIQPSAFSNQSMNQYEFYPNPQDENFTNNTQERFTQSPYLDPSSYPYLIPSQEEHSVTSPYVTNHQTLYESSLKTQYENLLPSQLLTPQVTSSPSKRARSPTESLEICRKKASDPKLYKRHHRKRDRTVKEEFEEKIIRFQEEETTKKETIIDRKYDDSENYELGDPCILELLILAQEDYDQLTHYISELGKSFGPEEVIELQRQFEEICSLYQMFSSKKKKINEFLWERPR